MTDDAQETGGDLGQRRCSARCNWEFVCWCAVLLLGIALPVRAQLVIERIQVADNAVESVTGVIFFEPGARQSQSRALRLRQELPAGAEIIVPARTTLTLRSRNRNEVVLFAGARFKTNAVTDEGETHALRDGFARFSVVNALSFFNVEFERFAALVRGTQFTMQVKPGNQVRWDVSEGEVRVNREGEIRISGAGVMGGMIASNIVRAGTYARPEVNYRLDVTERAVAEFDSIAGAESYYRNAWRDAERSDDYDRKQVARNDLGTLLYSMGRPQLALEYFETGTKDAGARGDRPWQARMLNNLGSAWIAARNYDDAISALEQALKVNLALAPDGVHRRIAGNYINLGVAYKQKGEIERSIEYFRRALDVDERLYGAGPERTLAGAHDDLGNALLRLGRLEEARPHLEAALAQRRALFGSTPHPELADSYNNMGALASALREPSRAAEFHTRALNMRRQLFGSAPHPAVAISLFNLGNALCASGDCQTGIRYHEQALAMRLALYRDAPHPDIVESYRHLAQAWRAMGDEARAEEYARSAAEMASRILK